MENVNPSQLPPKKINWVIVSLVIFLLAIFTISIFSIFYYQRIIKSRKSTVGQVINKKGDNLFSFNLVKPAFAEFTDKQSNIAPRIPYQPAKFSELSNVNSFIKDGLIEFSEGQKNILEKNGFYLTKNDIIGDPGISFGSSDDYYNTYKNFSGSWNPYFREGRNALFISSDYALHTFHILIDRSFQRLEETKLQPQIRSITKAFFLDSIDNYNKATDSKIKDSYKRLSVFYLVPLAILDAGSNTKDTSNLKPEDFSDYAKYIEAVDKANENLTNENLHFKLPTDKIYAGQQLSEEIYKNAQDELSLIEASKGVLPSPLFSPLRPDFKQDYSQFKPRSHYTKNAILKSYFTAMMWYGRSGFALKSPEQTRDAIIITGQINNLEADGQPIAKLWSDFAAIIDFFVGEPDDLTPYDYTKAIEKSYGSKISEEDLADDGLLNKFIATAKDNLPQPKILSEAIMMNSIDEKSKNELLAETMQFRFLGQRFTLDAYILNKLTQGDEAADSETGQKLPSTPTALMPISLLQPDNQVVKDYLNDWINDPERIKHQQRESDKVIAKVYKQLQSEISTFDSQKWTSNIYWSWLDCFRPLLSNYSQGYPFFMVGDSWQQKNLGTVLGSYTELKHDTLLYAKQSYAELGGGGPDETKMPPVVKGYVEPDLVFWNKIIALAEKTKSGLIARDAMPDEFAERYDAFLKSATFFRDLAIKELNNEKISDDDFEKLRTINADWDLIFSPLSGQELTPKEKRAGIIADIHTNVPLSEILYEATGKPFIIYVAIKDANGTRLTRGAVYSHYEFTDKLDERLTDEDWQAKVYLNQGKLPAGDKWSQKLLQN